MLDSRSLNESEADSAVLRPLESYGHRFDEVGLYRIFVRQSEVEVARQWVSVVDDPAALPQVSVDLATLLHGDRTEPRRDDPGEEARRQLKTGGVALWYSGASDRELSIVGTAIRDDRETPSFDSRELREGDFFSVVFLRPGAYRVSNGLGRAEAEITVINLRRVGGRDRDPSVSTRAVAVTCTERGFVPAEVQIERGQGVVWFVQGSEPFRIVVAPAG